MGMDGGRGGRVNLLHLLACLGCKHAPHMCNLRAAVGRRLRHHHAVLRLLQSLARACVCACVRARGGGWWCGGGGWGRVSACVCV